MVKRVIGLNNPTLCNSTSKHTLLLSPKITVTANRHSVSGTRMIPSITCMNTTTIARGSTQGTRPGRTSYGNRAILRLAGCTSWSQNVLAEALQHGLNGMDALFEETMSEE